MEEPIPMTPASTHLRRLSLLLLASLAGCASIANEPTTPARMPATEPATAVVAPSPAPEQAPALPPLSVDLKPAAAPVVAGASTAAEPAVPAATLLKPLTEEEEAALRSDLWVRVRRGFAMPALDNDHVRKWEQYYGSKPDYMRRMTERGGRYLFHIVEEVDKRGMPTELALLPFIESAFNPQAMSSARASGMWQFMPGTGRDFELRQNIFRDDRRSVLDSTRAALDYLQKLHRMFGNWQHALAAYNWGQGNVSRAIARNQMAGLSTSYEALTMPDETRNYVPKLQAIRNIVLNPGAFNLALPKIENHPYFLTVEIDRDIDVALAARLAGMSLDDFQQLNPQMNKPVILAAGTPHLVLPFDNAKHFARELARHRGPLATWTAWVAPKTVKPADAARTVGMSEAQLREVNRIPPRMLVKAGSTLLVPRAAHATRDVSERVADTAAIALAPEPVPGRRKLVKAGPNGETVAAMAKRLRVAPAHLARWNGVAATGRFAPKATVIVMLPPAKPSAKGATRLAVKSGKPAARPVARRVRVAKR
jgi:membrane-bound lytic murein transglycosylase D